jgi:hypothetical protein
MELRELGGASKRNEPEQFEQAASQSFSFSLTIYK